MEKKRARDSKCLLQRLFQLPRSNRARSEQEKHFPKTIVTCKDGLEKDSRVENDSHLLSTPI